MHAPRGETAGCDGGIEATAGHGASADRRTGGTAVGTAVNGVLSEREGWEAGALVPFVSDRGAGWLTAHCHASTTPLHVACVAWGGADDEARVTAAGTWAWDSTIVIRRHRGSVWVGVPCSVGRWVAAMKQDRPPRIDHSIAGLAYGSAYRIQRRPSRYKADLRQSRSGRVG